MTLFADDYCHHLLAASKYTLFHYCAFIATLSCLGFELSPLMPPSFFRAMALAALLPPGLVMMLSAMMPLPHASPMDRRRHADLYALLNFRCRHFFRLPGDYFICSPA